MNDDAQRARSIFLRAVEERRPDEWDAYLDETCGSDAALREQVRILLKAHGESNSLLDAPGGALANAIDRPIAEQPGAVIGPYKLLEQIGEGGFGVVFMAEQQHPVRRKVALKVLKPGMDTRQVVARFEAERQALALMDHPNIAHVLDGGAVGQAFEPDADADAQARKPDLQHGRPYFVMELVRGAPITEFCDQKSLAVRQRLELFVDVCQAVQHAHQKGIIHRDIKPTNVLVTLHDGAPVVKVIDFGIAKAMGQQLTEKTLFTNFAQLIGTPTYMSPEQAEMSGLDVDTRSDIYSLGVLLYELLTGTTPFEIERLSKVGYDEMRRIIREEEPPRPSARISTVGKLATTASQKRQGDPHKLSRLFRGEIDWIVMKALEKERNRRYETANNLALDVQHYLRDEPVLACPPSASYRLGKFARRNKRGLATAALLGMMLLAVVGVVGWAVRDRSVREHEAALDRQTRRDVIRERVTLALDEAGKRYQDGRWKEALDAAKRAEALAAPDDGDEETRRRARQVLADMQMLARLENVRARSSQNRVALTEECTGNAQAFRDYGIDIDALERDESVLRICARPIRRELAVLLDSWSHVRRKLEEQGIKPAKDWKELLEIARAADPDPRRDRFRNAVLNDDRQGLVELAASTPISSLRVETVDRLGDALMVVGAIEEAAVFLKEGQRLYPQDYWINTNVGRCLEQMAPPQLDGAIHYFTAALALHPEAAHSHERLGAALAANGELEAAIAQFRAGLRSSDDAPVLRAGLGRAVKAKSRRDAALAVRLSQWEKAAAEYAQADVLSQPLNDDAFAYACLFLIRGDCEGYHRFCQDMIQHAAEADEPGAPYVLARSCAMARESSFDPARALEWANQAVAGSRRPWDFHVLGLAQHRAGQFDQALQSFTQANVEAWASSDVTWFALALVHERLGHPVTAQQCLDKGVQWLERKGPENLPFSDWLEAQLLRREAEEMAVAAYRVPLELDPNDAQAHVALAQIHARKGQWIEAAFSLTRAIELDPKDNWAAYQLGFLLAELGDLPAYQEYCSTMLSRWGKVIEPTPVLRTAIALLLLADGVADSRQLAPLIEVALSVGENDKLYPWALFAKGLYDYRCARFTDARTACAGSRERAAPDFVALHVADQTVEAMSFYRLGRTAEARSALAAARRLLDEKGPKLDRGDLGEYWPHGLRCRILLREAAALIEGHVEKTRRE